MSNTNAERQLPAWLPAAALLGSFALFVFIFLPPTRPTSMISGRPQSFNATTAYAWSCAGCHDPDGNGNEPFGPGFLTTPLLEDRSALLDFLTNSQPPENPAIVFPHPTRGGYPELTDEQLSQLLDYVYTLTAG